MNRRRLVGQIAVTTVILQAGCVDTVPTNETEADSDADSDNQTMDETNSTESGEAEALYAPLPGLISAENRTAYAAEHDLQYSDGVVSVRMPLTRNERLSLYTTDDIRLQLIVTSTMIGHDSIVHQRWSRA
jgi:hypothetical protein